METAPLCPQCGDAMRLARKLPPVRPLSGLVVHLCGRCGYVGTAEREPDPPTTEVASTDARRAIFPVSCPHSRTPMIGHGRPAKNETDLPTVRGAHEAREAIALARPQSPRGHPVLVHRPRCIPFGRTIVRAGQQFPQSREPHRLMQRAWLVPRGLGHGLCDGPIDRQAHCHGNQWLGSALKVWVCRSCP
jgi:hypothetical protein